MEYLLPGFELLGAVERHLRPYLYHDASFYNFNPLLEASIEEVIYGQSFCHDGSAVEMAISYGVPSAPAHEIMGRFKEHLTQTFERVFGEAFDTYAYEFEVLRTGDIRLYANIPKPRPRPDNMLDLDEIRAGIDNGDYYPEHIRRLVGR